MTLRFEPTFKQLLYIFLFVITLFSCLQDTNKGLHKDSKVKLPINKYDILFGYEAPPNAFYNEKGEYVGMLVDFYNELSNISGINFNMKTFSTWEDLMQYAENNKDFVVVGITHSPKRERYLNFTNSFIQIPYVIITQKNSDIKNMTDLKSKNVCTVARYSVNEHLRKYHNNINVHPVSDNLEGIRAVSEGKFDAMITNQMYASYIISEQRITNLKNAGESDYHTPLCVGVSKSNRELFLTMNKAVNTLDKSSIREIYNRWFYISEKKISPRIVHIISIVSIVAISIIILMWIWLSTLKRQVNKKTRELLIAKEKAEESDRLKTAFLANMSHEIRTPMNGILGFANLLSDPDIESNEIEEYIKIINESGSRMLNTINDIIDISKIEAGEEQLLISAFSVSDKLKSLYKLYKPLAEKKGIDLILTNMDNDGNLTIETDNAKLDSIISNLLNNAIKFTHTGFIEFGISSDIKTLTFFVKDSGVGIPPEKLKSIFNRFEQGDMSSSKRAEGAGLGLTIAKSYSLLLGGELWVKSIVNKGSEFYFSLPTISS